MVAAVLAGVIVPWARETLLAVAILMLELLHNWSKGLVSIRTNRVIMRPNATFDDRQ